MANRDCLIRVCTCIFSHHLPVTIWAFPTGPFVVFFFLIHRHVIILMTQSWVNEVFVAILIWCCIAIRDRALFKWRAWPLSREYSIFPAMDSVVYFGSRHSWFVCMLLAFNESLYLITTVCPASSWFALASLWWQQWGHEKVFTIRAKCCSCSPVKVTG